MSQNRSLKSRNVFIRGFRTSIRLENESWDALSEICLREGKNIHQICTMVDENRNVSNRTSAIRSYIISYFRKAAAQSGYVNAGIEI